MRYINLKYIAILVIIHIFSACTGNMKKNQAARYDTLVRARTDSSIVTLQKEYENTGDTIFLNERFLILGSKNMHLDYIDSRNKDPEIMSKGDTLFHDKTVTILGDRKYYTKIYVRYYSKYKFSQFKVDSIYHGKLADADVSAIKDNKYWESVKRCTYLNIEEWKEYLVKQCRENGINFAGHYTVVSWGCGCQCQLMAIINRVDGKIYFPEIPENHLDGYYGAHYCKDSRMIISNAALLDDYKGYYLKYYDCFPEIYEWNDTLTKRLE